VEPVRRKRWRFRDADTAAVDRLARAVQLSPLLARILVARGITGQAEAEAYLSPALSSLPDPAGLSGMARAVERLLRSAMDGETVCVHGDYDVDGITATALLLHFFHAVGITAFSHIPHRILEGYGLSADGIREAAGKGATVIVTVDCGITAVDEAELCRELGVDLIITDHHTPPAALPSACAIINPHLENADSPFRPLAGVGVAFMLMTALRTSLRLSGWFDTRQEPNLRKYLDLVALGTIADMVDLVGVNRVLAAVGLRELSDGHRAGIRALKNVSGVSGNIGAGEVGFRLAPRINAAGRLAAAAPGVELLLTEDEGRAAQLARQLDDENGARQAVEQDILQEALAQVRSNPRLAGRKSIVLASEEWHPGVIGIVASRLVQLYHRPTILISLKDGTGKGSGRSIPALHLYEALHACAGHLVQFGGHRQAAGLSIDPATLEQFAEHFDQVASGMLSPEDLLPELLLDGEVAPEEITENLVSTLAQLAPYGMGNPEPLFLLAGARVVERKILKDSHLKLRLRAGEQTFEAIGFNMAGMDLPEVVDVAFTPGLNTWNGRQTLQLRLKGIRPGGTSPC
jgi:single-stranded-DNA-specific exonuclease